MATTEQDVRTEINSKIKLNKKRLITGPVLNAVLNLIITYIVELFNSIQTITGPKGEPGAKGADGNSAYEVWKAIAGNEAKTLADYWSFLSTTGGFSFNLIYYNNTELVMSQPKAWTIQTVTYTTDITLLEYSINNAAFAAITNGANNLSIAANAVINFRITFASGKIQTSINLTGIY